MSSLSVSKRELSLQLIEHGKHISTLERYVEDKFPTLAETNYTCLISKLQKIFLPHFKLRWNTAGRKKDNFLRKYSEWLDENFTVVFEGEESPSSSSGGKRGRPCKDYEISSERSKHRKAVKLFREAGLDHVHHSYLQGLRSIGEVKQAAILDELRFASSDILEIIHKVLIERKSSLEPYSNEEALAILLDLDLTKQQYEYLRNCIINKGFSLFPTYKQMVEAKQQCYPGDITVTDISAKVKLQSLLDHTANRLLMIDSLDLPDEGRLVLYSKWGMDGSSGQSEYKQILTGESELVSDSNLFISSLVPLKLTIESNGTIIWQNPAPSSTRFCRPILIEFEKETPTKTKSIMEDIESQISTLTPSAVTTTELKLSVKHVLFLTMVDGKVVQVLTGTASSATCSVCLAKPSEMNNLERVKRKSEREETFKFGLSTLHAWIRFMELVLHISYNMSFQKWSAVTAENKQQKEATKKIIQERFRNELGLIVDKPRQVSGNSNDGNTARRFFINISCTSAITGFDEELLKRFYVILQTMSCGRAIDPLKFGNYARTTAELYVKKYNWYYMPASVHKVLLHGENIIRYNAIVPLGQLSEDAQESRNKDYKRFRLHHSRKCSRVATNTDVFHNLLCTSDPYISSIRHQPVQQSMELDEEVLNLLE